MAGILIPTTPTHLCLVGAEMVVASERHLTGGGGGGGGGGGRG